MATFKYKNANGDYQPIKILEENVINYWNNKKILHLGDSVIDDYNKPVNTTVPYHIQQTLGSKEVINGAFGGSMAVAHPDSEFAKISFVNLAYAIITNDWRIPKSATFSMVAHSMGTTQAQAYYDKIDRISNIDFSTIHVIVLSYGTNDWANSTPLNNSDNKFDRSTYLGVLRYGIREILRKFPHIRILVTQPIFRSTSDRSQNIHNWKNNNGNGLTLIDWANGLNDTFNKDSFIPVSQTLFDLGINEFNEGHYLPDGTHLNAIGRQILGQKIANTIRYVY